jgi:hypothetical protein
LDKAAGPFQAKSLVAFGGNLIVTGGGHVYLPSWQRLASFYHHSVTTARKNQRDFQA